MELGWVTVAMSHHAIKASLRIAHQRPCLGREKNNHHGDYLDLGQWKLLALGKHLFYLCCFPITSSLSKTVSRGSACQNQYYLEFKQEIPTFHFPLRLWQWVPGHSNNCRFATDWPDIQVFRSCGGSYKMTGMEHFTTPLWRSKWKWHTGSLQDV
jgi:hypothetical protein